MARNNHVFVVGDITGDIHFDVFEQDSRTLQFLRLYMFVKPTETSRQLEGIRIVAYGLLAELVYSHVQKGSRLCVTGHIQSREVRGQRVVEIVAEDVQYLRNIDWERGKLAVQRLTTGENKRRLPVGFDSLDDLDPQAMEISEQYQSDGKRES